MKHLLNVRRYTSLSSEKSHKDSYQIIQQAKASQKLVSI